MAILITSTELLTIDPAALAAGFLVSRRQFFITDKLAALWALDAGVKMRLTGIRSGRAAEPVSAMGASGHKGLLLGNNAAGWAER